MPDDGDSILVSDRDATAGTRVGDPVKTGRSPGTSTTGERNSTGTLGATSFDYDEIKRRFAQERDLRLSFRPPGTDQYITELKGDLAAYETDPFAGDVLGREPFVGRVDVLLIGGGFSGLLTSARLRERGIDSTMIIDRASDFGGAWYWNRYPGIACDVIAYDYLPLLDETGYVPSRHYAPGQEIYEYCRMIARRYNLYESALFQTTASSTVWDSVQQAWIVTTDRGDEITARFVVCGNGILSKPKLARIAGISDFGGHSFHTSRWDYNYTGRDLEKLGDKVVGIIGTGASAVQVIPNLGVAAKELYVFQRTPSSIDVRNDWETDPEWAKRLQPGWQAARREKAFRSGGLTDLDYERKPDMTIDEKIRAQEKANIDYMMRIHRRIDEIVVDRDVAESLKPWYMFMCKRPCFHNDYLPTFNRPNVHLVDTHGEGITEIGVNGPIFHGRTYPLDLLIYATGFEVQKTGIYNSIVGANGIELNEKYRQGVSTLFGIHSHGFPNLFIMGGYQAQFNFNLTFVLLSQGEHIAECIAYMREHGHRTIDASAAAEQRWVQEVIKHRGKTSRNQDCTPGYYNLEGDVNRRQDGTYNGGIMNYLEFMAKARADMSAEFDLS